MSDENHRPLPGDPGAEHVAAMFETGDDWLLSAPGGWSTAAAETMQTDGTGFQRVVIVEIAVRPNHGVQREPLRLMIAPEDALGLAESLAHTSAYLLGLAT